MASEEYDYVPQYDGDWVIAAIESLGWNRAFTARQFGLSKSHLTRIIKGERAVPTSLISRLLEVGGEAIATLQPETALSAPDSLAQFNFAITAALYDRIGELNRIATEKNTTIARLLLAGADVIIQENTQMNHSLES
jgi:hypothetical protein